MLGQGEAQSLSSEQLSLMGCDSESNRSVLSARGGQGTGETEMEAPVFSLLPAFILERRYQTHHAVMAPSTISSQHPCFPQPKLKGNSTLGWEQPPLVQKGLVKIISMGLSSQSIISSCLCLSVMQTGSKQAWFCGDSRETAGQGSISAQKATRLGVRGMADVLIPGECQGFQTVAGGGQKRERGKWGGG